MDRFDDPRHKKWASEVKNRDLYTCQICFAHGVYLHSHHLNSWNSFVEGRYDVSNGITLCHECHSRFHFIFGHGNNTKLQFAEFKNTIELIKKIVRSNLK